MKCNVVKVCPRGRQRYQYVINYEGCDLSFLSWSVGLSVDGSVCPFTARKSDHTRSLKFLEETRRRWLGPRERDGSDGSSEARTSCHGHRPAARASAGMKGGAWQTAGT